MLLTSLFSLSAASASTSDMYTPVRALPLSPVSNHNENEMEAVYSQRQAQVLFPRVKINPEELKELLKTINRVEEAFVGQFYNSPIRQDILTQISSLTRKMIYDPVGVNVLYLSGPAGSGKNTYAQFIAQTFKRGFYSCSLNQATNDDFIYGNATQPGIFIDALLQTNSPHPVVLVKLKGSTLSAQQSLARALSNFEKFPARYLNIPEKNLTKIIVVVTGNSNEISQFSKLLGNPVVNIPPYNIENQVNILRTTSKTYLNGEIGFGFRLGLNADEDLSSTGVANIYLNRMTLYVTTLSGHSIYGPLEYLRADIKQKLSIIDLNNAKEPDKPSVPLGLNEKSFHFPIQRIFEGSVPGTCLFTTFNPELGTATGGVFKTNFLPNPRPTYDSRLDEQRTGNQYIGFESLLGKETTGGRPYPISTAPLQRIFEIFSRHHFARQPHVILTEIPHDQSINSDDRSWELAMYTSLCSAQHQANWVTAAIGQIEGNGEITGGEGSLYQCMRAILNGADIIFYPRSQEIYASKRLKKISSKITDPYGLILRLPASSDKVKEVIALPVSHISDIEKSLFNCRTLAQVSELFHETDTR